MQCEQCEFFVRGPAGEMAFRCDPFCTIKEPECLLKWQLLRIDAQVAKLDTMVRAYQATLDMYRRLAPLQEKMFRHMEREINEAEEGDSWKYRQEDEDGDESLDDDPDRLR